MTLRETITKDRFLHLKSGNKELAGFMGLIVAEINAQEKELGQPITDQQLTNVLESMLKKLNEALIYYQAPGQEEKCAEEQKKCDLLNHYLPEILSSEKANAILEDVIQEFPDPTMKDMGRILSAMREHITGRADWKAISESVKMRCAKKTQ
jgi:uncharacterized protein